MTAPCWFLSHGAPDLILDHDDPAHQALRDLGRATPPPRAVLVVSAHWTTARPAVGCSLAPATLHDFGGFAPALYRLRYPAPGAPAVAAEAVAALAAAGIAAQAVERDLDHGVWVPLGILWPQAQVPVVPCSVQPHADGAHHVALGRALAPLRERGVLILGSGSTTHNLGAVTPGIRQAPPWVSAFDDWFVATATAGDHAALAQWTTAPHAHANHPTPEHLLPALVAAGAGGRGRARHRSTAWGVLAMTIMEFV